MSGDTILIQDAMGEKVGKFIQLTSTFIGVFVIAYVRGWLLALVLPFLPFSLLVDLIVYNIPSFTCKILNMFIRPSTAKFKTINREPNIDAYDTSGVVLNDIKGAIELKDVYFKYPARPDVQIFSGFSLNIRVV